MNKQDEFEGAQRRLIALDEEIEIMRSFIAEHTGYLKIKLEERGRLLRKMAELRLDSEDA